MSIQIYFDRCEPNRSMLGLLLQTTTKKKNTIEHFIEVLIAVSQFQDWKTFLICWGKWIIAFIFLLWNVGEIPDLVPN